MGSANIPSANDNTIIPASDHNSLRNALIGDHVPRNASGNAEDELGNLGSSSFKWLNAFIKKIFIGSIGSNISLEDDAGDLVVKVGGNERARIAQPFQFIPPGTINAYCGTTDLLNNSGTAEWFICDGRQVSRTTYARLYAAIGDSFGEGDGANTFHLPDLRGRFLRGVDSATGRDPDAASRTEMATGGNTGDAVGSIQNDALKIHTHSKATINNANFGGDDAMTVGSPDTFTTTVDAAGDSTESRPKNVNVNWLIKT